MKPSSGRLSNYETRASAASHDSAESSVGDCTKEAFLVGERTFLRSVLLQFGQRKSALETK